MSSSLDTNVLLRWILGDVPERQRRVDKMLSRKHTYHVADMALLEVVYVMEKVAHLPRAVIVEAMHMLIAQANINCNRALLGKVLPAYIKHSSVSFTDCCLAAYAESNNATPLYTFDKKMARDLPHVELIQ